MRKYILIFALSIFSATNLLGQDLNNYKYVQVPKKFEFLKVENQYQLNALTAFLFEKYGFQVLYEEEIPSNVEICEVLQGDVQNKTAIFTSRVYVTLKDCNGKEVFTSKVGTSREKDFERSYHEALREAFTSFKGLRNPAKVIVDTVPDSDNQLLKKPAEVIIDPVPGSNVDQPNKVAEIIIDPAVSSEEMAEVEASREKTSSEFITLVNGPTIYRLKKTSAGYDLFQKDSEDKFATLIKSGGGDHYLYSSKMISGNAFFDANRNLVVEYLDPNTQQLVSVVYKRKDQ